MPYKIRDAIHEIQGTNSDTDLPREMPDFSKIVPDMNGTDITLSDLSATG